jgi:hypothetical protein
LETRLLKSCDGPGLLTTTPWHSTSSLTWFAWPNNTHVHMYTALNIFVWTDRTNFAECERDKGNKMPYHLKIISKWKFSYITWNHQNLSGKKRKTSKITQWFYNRSAVYLHAVWCQMYCLSWLRASGVYFSVAHCWSPSHDKCIISVNGCIFFWAGSQWLHWRQGHNDQVLPSYITSAQIYRMWWLVKWVYGVRP